MAALERAGVSILAEQVLKRTKEDEGSFFVDVFGVSPGRSRKVLPAVEVDMRFEVGFPSVFDCGFESDHEHALRTHALCELVRGEGLAEAHLRVPEKLGHCVVVFCPAGVEVVDGLLYRFLLLIAHVEVGVVRALVALARTQLGDRCSYVCGRATHPLAARLVDDVFETLFYEASTHVGVGEN